MDLNEPVSGRQFAKMVGQAESAVRKAKNRGSILKGLTADGKFIPLIASREWGKPILEVFLNDEEIVVVSKAEKRTPVIKREKKEPTSAEDFVNEMMHESVPKVSKKEIQEFDEDQEGEMSEGTTKVEAERRIAIYKAKMAELAYKEKKKTLINIDKLKVIYEYGAQIRSDIEGIPDRIIDEILANAEDRKASKRILVEEIYNTLNRLSDFKINV
jgi:hypothetical protein